LGLLLKQLEKNTNVVENIKREIAHSDWLAKENISLRLSKLEELLNLATELDKWSEETRNYSLYTFDKEAIGPDSRALLRMQTIHILYFPRLFDATSTLIAKCLTFNSAMAVHRGKIMSATQDKKQEVIDEAGKVALDFCTDIFKLILALQSKAKDEIKLIWENKWFSC